MGPYSPSANADCVSAIGLESKRTTIIYYCILTLNFKRISFVSTITQRNLEGLNINFVRGEETVILALTDSLNAGQRSSASERAAQWS